MSDCCIGVIPTMLEQLLKFKSDVRLGRKEVVFNEIRNVSEMRSTSL